METCPRCGWSEERAARLRELEALTRAADQPQSRKLPAGIREERTNLEQQRLIHEGRCLLQDEEPEEEYEALTWEEALEDAPTQALIDELQRRALDAGGTLPVYADPVPPGPESVQQGRPVLTHDRIDVAEQIRERLQGADDDEMRPRNGNELPRVREGRERHVREEDARRKGSSGGETLRHRGDGRPRPVPAVPAEEEIVPREIGQPRR